MKSQIMKQGTRMLLVIVLAGLFLACNSSARDKKDELAQKRQELKEKKQQSKDLDADIQKLEEEIAKLDPSSRVEKAKLVTLTPITAGVFTHYIDLQGEVQAENISYVTPRGGPGQVRAVYVQQGDYVRKGKLLLKMDDALIRQNIQTARLQVANAENVYQRYKNLRDQNIGTEVQLIAYKGQLDLARGQLNVLEEQLALTNVYAQVSGVAEEVNVKVGETFTGMAPTTIKIVNKSELKVVTDIPETYVSRVKRGTPVVIQIPSLNRTYNSTVTLISQAIGTNSRGFTVECRLPSDKDLKVNQVAKVQIQDYKVPDAITVPISTIQTDENGKYVLVAETQKGRRIAKKKPVGVGELYGEFVEIKTGLQSGDTLITAGFQNLYEGQPITTAG